MSRLTKNEIATARERIALKEEIRDLDGAKAIKKATKRLCLHCERWSKCFLVPITTKGEDCPYFCRKKEVK